MDEGEGQKEARGEHCRGQMNSAVPGRSILEIRSPRCPRRDKRRGMHEVLRAWASTHLQVSTAAGSRVL